MKWTKDISRLFLYPARMDPKRKSTFKRRSSKNSESSAKKVLVKLNNKIDLHIYIIRFIHICKNNLLIKIHTLLLHRAKTSKGRQK